MPSCWVLGTELWALLYIQELRQLSGRGWWCWVVDWVPGLDGGCLVRDRRCRSGVWGAGWMGWVGWELGKSLCSGLEEPNQMAM